MDTLTGDAADAYVSTWIEAANAGVALHAARIARAARLTPNLLRLLAVRIRLSRVPVPPRWAPSARRGGTSPRSTSRRPRAAVCGPERPDRTDA